MPQFLRRVEMRFICLNKVLLSNRTIMVSHICSCVCSLKFAAPEHGVLACLPEFPSFLSFNSFRGSYSLPNAIFAKMLVVLREGSTHVIIMPPFNGRHLKPHLIQFLGLYRIRFHYIWLLCEPWRYALL